MGSAPKSEAIFKLIEGVEVISGKNKFLVPGFINTHVQSLGGGGEGVYTCRTAKIMLSNLTGAGMTTVVGCLGQDGTIRSMATSAKLLKYPICESEAP